MRKITRRLKIHPPVTNAEAYAIGRKLLGIETAEDRKLLGLKPKITRRKKNAKKSRPKHSV